MNAVGVAEFRACVCGANACWQKTPIKEAGVTADLGAGWAYFLLEKHFNGTCHPPKVAEICDGLGVPMQSNRLTLIFLELKTDGSYAHAADQIRSGVKQILAYGIPNRVALIAQIWHSRDPQTALPKAKDLTVDGRTVFVRYRRSK